MLGLESPSVTGSHGIQVAMDGVFDGNFADYDLVVLPGGMPGSTNLRDNETLIASLQEAAKAGKYVAAICAAPIVLERAGLLEGRKFTCFPGVEEQIASGEHQTDLVVVDGNIVTSRGAGLLECRCPDALHPPAYCLHWRFPSHEVEGPR